MFFEFSRVFGFFTLPSNLLFIVAFAGAILLLTPWARAGLRLLVASIVLCALIGFLPIGNIVLYELEDRFPLVWDFPGPHPDGIIVLGGTIDPTSSSRRQRPVLIGPSERLSGAAELAERFPNARVVFTGGDGRLFAGTGSEADHAVPLLERLGISRERILVENRARNTFENAVFTTALVKPAPRERWLLVTSAIHMPRAVGAFRRAGFPVESYSVDRRMFAPHHLWPSISVIGGLYRFDEVVRECLGLLAYWLMGYTSELYPAPTAWDLRNKPGASRPAP